MDNDNDDDVADDIETKNGEKNGGEIAWEWRQWHQQQNTDVSVEMKSSEWFIIT